MYAAKKAMVSGQMRTGEMFPSVRELSKGLKINPNTAHKVIAQLVQEGLLEVHPGIGTVVAARQENGKSNAEKALGREMEELVVEAKKVGLSLEEVQEAMERHWRRLNGRRG